MRHIVLFAAVVLFSGCAFKQPEAKQEAAVVQQQSALPAKNQASYSAASADSREGEPPVIVTGSTTLNRDSTTNQLRGNFALVLPAFAPDILTIEARVMDASLPSSLRGELRSGDRIVREIPAAAFLIEGGRSGSPFSIKFALTEMKQYFAADSQVAMALHLLAVDDAGKPTPFLSLAITTPPSKTSTTPYLPVEAFEKKMKVSVPDSLRHATASDGRQVELVGIFEVRNSESAPIEVTVPQQLAHTLDAVELQTQVTSSECGYSVSRNPSSKRVASELWLLPLQTTANANGMTVRIAPGEVAHIGAFATVGAALTPGEDRMSPQVVPTRCMAHCQRGAEGDWNDQGKWGGECLACGGIPGNMGEVCYSCMRQHREWCAWQDWRAWKDYATVSVGTQYSFNMAPTADKDAASSKFLVKFVNQSVPGRPRQLLSESISIKR